MTITKDYGWRSEQGPTSCSYIQPAVLDALRLLKPRRVLDLGAGNGALCHALLQEDYEVVGVEPDTEGVRIARQNCPGAKFYQLTVDDGPDQILADYPTRLRCGGFHRGYRASLCAAPIGRFRPQCLARWRSFAVDHAASWG